MARLKSLAAKNLPWPLWQNTEKKLPKRSACDQNTSKIKKWQGTKYNSLDFGLLLSEYAQQKLSLVPHLENEAKR